MAQERKIRKIVKTIKPSESELRKFMKEHDVPREQALACLVKVPGKGPSKADIKKIMEEYDETEEGARLIYLVENDMMDGFAQELTPEGDLILYDD